MRPRIFGSRGSDRHGRRPSQQHSLADAPTGIRARIRDEVLATPARRGAHTGIASRLLGRSIALDPDLGRRIDRWPGRQAFVDFLTQHSRSHWSGGPIEITPMRQSKCRGV